MRNGPSTSSSTGLRTATGALLRPDEPLLADCQRRRDEDPAPPTTPTGRSPRASPPGDFHLHRRYGHEASRGAAKPGWRGRRQGPGTEVQSRCRDEGIGQLVAAVFGLFRRGRRLRRRSAGSKAADSAPTSATVPGGAAGIAGRGLSSRTSPRWPDGPSLRPGRAPRPVPFTTAVRRGSPGQRLRDSRDRDRRRGPPGALENPRGLRRPDPGTDNKSHLLGRATSCSTERS